MTEKASNPEVRLSTKDLTNRKIQALEWLFRHRKVIGPSYQNACRHVKEITTWYHEPSTSRLVRAAKDIIDSITQSTRASEQSKRSDTALRNRDLFECLLAIATMCRGANGKPVLPPLFAEHGSGTSERTGFARHDFDWFTKWYLDEFNALLYGARPKKYEWIPAVPLAKQESKQNCERCTTDNNKTAAKALFGLTSADNFSSKPASPATNQPLASLDARKRSIDDYETLQPASKVPRTSAPTSLTAPSTTRDPPSSSSSLPQSDRRAVDAAPHMPYPNTGTSEFSSLTNRIAEATYEAAKAKREAQSLRAANAAYGTELDKMKTEIEKLSTENQALANELNKSSDEQRKNELSAHKELSKVMVERDQARREANKWAEAAIKIDSTCRSVLFDLQQPVEADEQVEHEK
ncbi:hypothetical protein M406DRAFT_66741 [Cryphonectria parasitica EP155]|uniref:Uncharacterized protein n=1 Tax=Cryphonectria parasitica (strain ATCC 38755 / EP155) TaxID=660469 RepID=A0A9P5CU30_CRYP1|nr:uncharacterized protein M406DRAFT_66741 [Cryphonectria parasitica EP155]KAF3770327.1 hypothetical protein M406DRAFT_66741 [Cryphonectria parasitica EP155]